MNEHSESEHSECERGRESSLQKIFSINQLVQYVRDQIPDNVKLETVSVMFKPKCALLRNSFNKTVVYCKPINIKVIGHNGNLPYIERLDLNSMKKEFGNDFGIKFNLRKYTKIYDSVDINLLKIDATKHKFRDYVYYNFNNKPMKDDNPNPRFQTIRDAHKSDSAFSFRPKPADYPINDDDLF